MGRAVDHRRQRVRPGSTPRQSGRRSGSGGRTLLRRRCRYAPGRGPPRPGRGAGVARPGGRSGRVPGTRGGRRHAGLSRLPGPRRGPGREGDRCLGGRGPPVLDAELDEHLVALPNGRYGWRISLPAMVCYWSELARDIVLPPVGTATTLVRAVRASPAYVSDQLLAAWTNG